MDLKTPSISKGQWSLSNGMQAGWILNSNNPLPSERKILAGSLWIFKSAESLEPTGQSPEAEVRCQGPVPAALQRWPCRDCTEHCGCLHVRSLFADGSYKPAGSFVFGS